MNIVGKFLGIADFQAYVAGLVLTGFAIFVMTAAGLALAKAHPIPPPCVELAYRHDKPLPSNEREARKARWEVSMLALFGDPLARACRKAINAELRK